MKIYEYDGKKNICGEQIRKIRMEKKMSQAALSRALQLEGITIDRYSICRMEKGERFIADYELIDRRAGSGKNSRSVGEYGNIPRLIKTGNVR